MNFFARTFSSRLFYYILLACLLALFTMSLVGCSVNTSSGIDINTNHIVYKKDHRTGICYAFIAARKTGSPTTTGLAMSDVPCEVAFPSDSTTTP